MKWDNKPSANISIVCRSTLVKEIFSKIHLDSLLLIGFPMNFLFPPVAYQKQNFVTNFRHGY